MENQPETKKCPSCQSDVSVKATKCPHCQSDLRNWFQKHPLITILLVLIALSSVFSNIISLPSKESSTKQNSQKKSQPTISTIKKENSEAILKEGQILGKYNYTVGRKAGETRLVAIFNPFLPRDDKVLTSAMHELINQSFGKNTVSDLEPKLVSRGGTNLIMLKSTSGSYLFMPFKEDTGEVNGLVFWKEEAGELVFEASVKFTGTQFIIANFSDVDCVSADMAVNSGLLIDGYTLEGYTLKTDQTYTVGVLQFTKGEKRLNPEEIKPKNFYIYCRGSNALDGKSWFGSFE